MIRRLSVPILVGVCTLLAACSSEPDEQITGVGPMSGDKKQTQTDNRRNFDRAYDVDIPAEQPSMKNLMEKRQAFPPKYPVVKYPNSSVVLVRIEPKLYPGWRNQVLLQSTDTPHRIAQYYRTLLPKQGWVKFSDRENSAYSSTIWHKDGQEIEVRVVPDPHHGENVQLLSGPADTVTAQSRRSKGS